ncbi:site-specific integrase [Rhizobium tubonense]|uniref:Tyr recombinase domain-containing protein n=1 Tax=Rhizobium tubonense TaxID=484088 RepID=A0A2W4E6S5_9HYPH|nr:site-specific integrase [Rhizobium tubonense]PZM07560.1 hypothetical protein CPY51_31000 [Rhizobium tubonense]
MAIASYLMRREGRYSLQIRYSRPLAAIIGKPLYRASLMTADYNVAKIRLVKCLQWFLPMNSVRENTQLYNEIARRIDEYLQDSMPLDPDRLLARQKFDEWKDASLLALSVDGYWNQYLFDDELQTKVALFQQQNVEADKYVRKGEAVRAYERGRIDMRDALAFDAISIESPRVRVESEGLISALEKSRTPRERDDLLAAPGRPVAPQENPQVAERLRISEALKLYIVDSRALKKSEDGLSTVALIIRFLIDEFNDPYLADLGGDDFERLNTMMPEIPNRNHIPREAAKSLSLRYRYAQEHGWDSLVRLTGETLQKGYHSALSKFFRWAIDKGLFKGEKPIFNHVSGENLVSLPRDSFSRDEVIEIISMPLFTGCNGPTRIWKPGRFFIQNHLYWAYIILLLTGLRTGELGQLRIADFVERDDIWYLDLRGFDPTKGRVAIKDVVNFKTEGSARIMPLHPLILDLGFLDRLAELEATGCEFAFPEWEPYFKPGGAIRWGQPMTKSWAYMKGKTSIVRKDVTLYSTRHFFADLVDNTDLTHRARKRLMGHSNKSDMATRYGSKTRLTTRDLKELVSVENPTIDQMSEILMDAKERANRGDLETLRPWVNRASWSDYYRKKMG